jgi:hypothetical protein
MKYYAFYIIKSKGDSFFFDFRTIYYVSFYFLIKFSIFPFLEAKLDKSFFIFHPYKIRSDVILKMNDIFISDSNKIWYLKCGVSSNLNSINKLWLFKNFPLGKTFFDFYFAQKNYFFCKSFHLIVFSYLFTGLVWIKS